MRRAYALPATLAAFVLLPGGALAAQSARLRVTFSSLRPGHGTNIGLEVAVAAARGGVPSPITGIDIRYPNELGLAVSELGLASCSRSTLEAHGPAACPPDSHMGQGTALAEVPFGPHVAREAAAVAIVRAPETEGHIAMYFVVTARWPILAEIVLPGVLLPTPAPFETIHIDVPLIGTLPGADDVSLVNLRANIGPRGLTYYENVGGKRIAYRPRGIVLPSRCPHDGFAFSLGLDYLDGTRGIARTRVRCTAPHARSPAG